MTITRSQDEISERIRSLESDGDFMGFRREVLIERLDFEHAAPWLREGVTAEEWAKSVAPVGPLEYLKFAIGKASDHRGISASRSVEKLGEMAWLAGRDDVVKAMDAADYENYGAPQLKAFADGMGFGDVWASEAGADVQRMAEGLPCVPGCDEGCGR